MALSDIVSVIISTSNPGVTAAGFGVPLITSWRATWAERVRSYANAAAVAVDFATTTPEYLAAAKAFAQSPAPPKIKIGRCALPPTQRFRIAVKSVQNSTPYKVRVGATTFTFTSDANATNDEIADGLAAAIIVAGLTATTPGAGGAHECLLTAAASALTSVFFDVEILDLALLTLAQDHADPGIATDLAAIALEDNDWYALITTLNSYALVLAAAGWVESNSKLYIAASADSIIPQTVYDATTTTDIGSKARAAGYARTGIFYHSAPGDFADAAIDGRFLPLNPGSETWRLKTLAGVSTKNYTGTHITNMEAKNTAYYYLLAGANVVGGKAATGSGEYIDVIRFRDWWVARVSEGLANLLITNNKIPYTDLGVAQLEAVVRGINQAGMDAGGINPDPAPVVTTKKVKDVLAADKTARSYPYLNSAWTLAGAIHKLTVNAQITT